MKLRELEPGKRFAFRDSIQDALENGGAIYSFKLISGGLFTRNLGVMSEASAGVSDIKGDNELDIEIIEIK